MELIRSWAVIGPGRWLNRPVFELWLQLNSSELQHLEQHGQEFHQRLIELLNSVALNPGKPLMVTPSVPVTEPARLAAQLLSQTAVLLQTWSGHRVEWTATMTVDSDGVVHTLFEFEELSTGTDAAELALTLINIALKEDALVPVNNELNNQLTAFRKSATAHVFPMDSVQLEAAAKARDIPVCRLDREPYEPIRGPFRLRDNGLMRFGHACHQQVVDGTLCLDRSAPVLKRLTRRSDVLQMLHAVGVPVPRFDPTPRNIISTKRALTAAKRIGYPVTVIFPGHENGAPIANEEQLINLVQSILGSHPEIHIEAWVEGELYHCLLAGQNFTAIVDTYGEDISERCHVSVLEQAVRVAEQLPVGMLALGVKTRDITLSLSETAGAFVSLDLSPQLDHLLPVGGELHRLMAGDFIDWMFPADRQSRMPIFSVTGTNGKTTTCRMLAQIAKQAGYRVGMACTDGIFLNETLVDSGDFSGRNGHHRILESREIDLGVLETARGAVLHSGFSFDHCDVTICTNITPEHLGEYGIETTRQMAEVKQMIVAKARTAAVLNFDDPECRHIGRTLTVPRLCWTSVTSNPDFIDSKGLHIDRLLHLQTRDKLEWIVDRHHGEARFLMPVGDIPATVLGTARHNISNALQAISAALELGVEWSDIHAAMSCFEMNIDTTPGRLNIHQGPGFPVLLDFVQNLDAMRALCDFVHLREVKGKRILVLSVLGRHSNDTVSEFARYAANNFDHFICRDYVISYEGRSKGDIPHLLRDALIEHGVQERDIQVIQDEVPAIDAALKLGRPDDLVVILCGIRPKENWKQISDFS